MAPSRSLLKGRLLLCLHYEQFLVRQSASLSLGELLIKEQGSARLGIVSLSWMSVFGWVTAKAALCDHSFFFCQFLTHCLVKALWDLCEIMDCFYSACNTYIDIYILTFFFLVLADFLAPQVILLRNPNHLLIWSIMHPPLMLLLLSRKEAAPYVSSLGISPKPLTSLVKSKYFPD